MRVFLSHLSSDLCSRCNWLWRLIPTRSKEYFAVPSEAVGFNNPLTDDLSYRVSARSVCRIIRIVLPPGDEIMVFGTKRRLLGSLVRTWALSADDKRCVNI